MRILIKGGRVIDGTGAPAVAGDLLVDGDTIAALGPLPAPPEDALVLDATGAVVTPGFVDLHRHCDIAPFADADFGRLELAQGITTVFGGNCGLAPVPTAPQSRAEVYGYIEPVTGPVPPGLAFESHAAYAAALEKAALGPNVGFFAGTGAIKTAVKGFDKSPFTPAEMAQAQALLQQALQAGAQGITLGIMYQPECWNTREEYIALLGPAAKYDPLVSVHVRGEGDGLVAAVEEVVAIAEGAGLRLNISHFKATGSANWRGAIFRAIERIEAARARGVQVTVDAYPYTAGATTLQSLLPPSLYKRDHAATMAWLATAGGKAAARKAMATPHPGWDNTAAGIGWDRVVVSSVSRPENQALRGRSIGQAAAEAGADPVDVLCDLLASENGQAGGILFSMDPADVDDIMRLPYCAVISDALYAAGDPHPRLYGAFPRVIRDFVHDRGILTLEQAVNKMTAMPAARVGLAGRGVLAKGMKADVAVFDPAQLADHATYEAPRQLATGMRHLLVNGTPAIRGGEWQGTKAGRAVTAAR